MVCTGITSEGSILCPFERSEKSPASHNFPEMLRNAQQDKQNLIKYNIIPLP